MGSLHARALSRGGLWNLVGVSDLVDPGWGIPWSADLGELLGRIRPDAAVVAVPPEHHDEVARTCLRSGCHVLLEKPICPAAPEAISLARDFRSAGQVLFGGHSERFHPVFRALERKLSDLSPRRVRCLRQGPAPRIAPPGGAVLDLGVHDLDLVQRVFPDLRLEGVDRDDRGRVRAHLGNADGADIDVICAYGRSRDRSWIIGDGSARWTADFLGRKLERPDGTAVELPPGDPLELEHGRFLDACRGRFDWWTDLQPQIRAVELARGILEADRLRQP
jgi:predicted dehydrogenase